MKNLNFGAFNSLYDLFEAFPTEAACIAYLESKRWENGVVSPYDPSSKVYHRGDGNYRCKNTGKNFNVRVGTIFERYKVATPQVVYGYLPNMQPQKVYLRHSVSKGYYCDAENGMVPTSQNPQNIP